VSDVHEQHTGALIEDLFRRESARLVAALVRLLGPAQLTLAEDVVHDALISAMQAWRFEIPAHPEAWILQVAKRRAIDLIRRGGRLEALRARLANADALEHGVELALSADADAENQLTMMLAICDDALSSATHVTLILRLLCGFSAAEIAGAFLLDTATIDRRLHRGRTHLAARGGLPVLAAALLRPRQPSIEQALYLLFNEGYHGSGTDDPLHPALCADAIRLAELLADAAGAEPTSAHALAALFCFDAARLATRIGEDGTMVALAEQDRSRWDTGLVERGIGHLGRSAHGEQWTRWHLEAGIAFEHTRASSLAQTDWAQIVAYYDALLELAPGPVVELNRGLAIAELRGLEHGRAALARLADDARLASYSFLWASLADLARRAGSRDEARTLYERAMALARSAPERRAYARRLGELAH
jgi:RNA polymerase sigma factor (sigma-70 family)